MISLGNRHPWDRWSALVRWMSLVKLWIFVIGWQFIHSWNITGLCVSTGIWHCLWYFAFQKQGSIRNLTAPQSIGLSGWPNSRSMHSELNWIQTHIDVSNRILWLANSLVCVPVTPWCGGVRWLEQTQGDIIQRLSWMKSKGRPSNWRTWSQHI